MKILKKVLTRKSKQLEGYVLLKPFDNDDIWYIYNILCLGDFVECRVKRKIAKEGIEGKKKKVDIKIFNIFAAVVKIDFLCDENGTSLILKVKNARENQYINKGAFQSIEIKFNQKIKIFKSHWDIISLRNLDESSENSKKSETLIILMEEGIANIYFLKNNYSIFRNKIEKSIPKKKGVNANNFKLKLEKFFEMILGNLEIINKKEMKIKYLLLAGPGLAKENFKKHCINIFNNKQNVDKEFKYIINSAVLVPTSNVFKPALQEIISNSNLANILKDFKAFKENKALELFNDTLRNKPNLAVYGYNDVSKAIEEKAVKVLLITDYLFKNTNFLKRKQFLDLVEKCKGEVVIFNKMLPAGMKLQEMSGIAAILNFEIEFVEDNNSSSEDSNNSFNEEQIDMDYDFGASVFYKSDGEEEGI